MLIYNLTKPELDVCLAECNFTPDEQKYFELRAKYKSHTEIALACYWSERKTSDISRKVREKVKKILRM